MVIWSATVVAVGILGSGAVSSLYVHYAERVELDDDLEAQAGHFFDEWHRHGGEHFDWVRQQSQVFDWLPVSSSPDIVEVTSGQTQILYRSHPSALDFLIGLPPGYHTVTVGATRWRVGAFVDRGIILYLATDMRQVNDLVADAALSYLITLPFVLVVVIFGGRLIARNALSPIQKIADFAERITPQGLGQRIPLPSARDEIHRLSSVLNDTFDRLEKSFHQATRFSADASHELKTPLTVLRTSVEALLRSPSLTEEDQRALTSILEDTNRLSAIIDRLLLLSRADAGKLTLDLHPGDLAEIVRLCTEDAGILYEGNGIVLECDLPASAPALVDHTRLSQILMNLFDNALKYNQAQGRVRITLVSDESSWEVRVANTGPGIAPEYVGHLFVRFSRGDHSSAIPGQGLGLSLSRELARSHHGDLILGESEPGWTTFVLIIPKLEGNSLIPTDQKGSTANG
jgi:signal transduction histidine kinase